MKTTLQAMSLALVLASPLAFSAAATAQETSTAPSAIVRVAQNDQEGMKAFFDFGYDYYDARVVSKFWGMDLVETKALMGQKLLWGGQSKAYLYQVLLDARVKALASADELNLYRDSGYGYDDAEKLAKVWGDETPYQSKLRIERNLIMGQDDLIRWALDLAQD